MPTLDDFRAVMAALDVIENSPVTRPCGGELWTLTTDARRLVERLRDAAEDVLFEEHARLGFESEKPVVVAEESVSPTQKVSPAEVARKAREARDEALRDVVLASNEPSNPLAKRLGVTVQVVSKIRKDAGDACAYYSGCALTAEQRDEIAKSAGAVGVLSKKYSVSKVAIQKIRRSGGVL